MGKVKYKHTNTLHFKEGTAGWKGLEFLAKPYEFHTKTQSESATERVTRWYKTYMKNMQMLSQHID